MTPKTGVMALKIQMLSIYYLVKFGVGDFII